MPVVATAAPYAAMVIDARSGKVLHSRNADTRLHPASLTKMMTLYVVFDAIEKGEISLDSKVLISRKAAAEQPSKLGLKAGSRIQLRYLIRAAAVKSANDAATALGEAISGSEAAFARRMTRMAKAMGMSKTTFKNAHGLTESGHLSTARDMTTLGRHLFYDFPEYYNLFSRRSTSAGIKTVNNTNRRLLGNYRGADGIKTGYTRAAGYNLVASAERGNERIIATVFGGRSTAWRNARVAELLDMGFDRAPSRVAVRKPSRPVLTAEGAQGTPGRIIRTSGLVTKSLRPRLRPVEAPPEEMLIALQDGIADALADVVADASTATPAPEIIPEAAPKSVLTASLASSLVSAPRPRARARPIAVAATSPSSNDIDDQIVVTRMSTSGGRQWAINVGRFTTRHEAEKMLLQTALVELGTLDEALRKVVRNQQGFDANFVGLTAQTAELACRRLLAQNVNCHPMGPS
ncbi:MAG: D-alanyl-D-alanine carboxypeptidase [Boseongicola sp.]|nr:serine hydrolase [Boseongicola sp.]NNL18761.1 D-alanyl-D-alanine carboxypeptidase [Boseongicola sp.]